MIDILNKAKKIKCLICDVDGVLTNGFLYIDNFGNEIKAFHVRDGIGLKLIMSIGIEVAVITAATTSSVQYRMQQLGIKNFFTGQIDKQEAFNKLKSNLGLKNEEFAYIGDDIPDVAIIKQVGLGIAVSNAVSQVKKYSIWETTHPGGFGAVREVCELLLRSKNIKDCDLLKNLKFL